MSVPHRAFFDPADNVFIKYTKIIHPFYFFVKSGNEKRGHFCRFIGLKNADCTVFSAFKHKIFLLYILFNRIFIYFSIDLFTKLCYNVELTKNRLACRAVMKSIIYQRKEVGFTDKENND